MIYLHKLLPILVSPIFIILLLAVLTLWLRARWLNWTLVAVILISSSPLIADWALRSIEHGYEHRPVAQAEPVDTVIVLGGMTIPVQSGNGTTHEFAEATDRLIAGINFITSGKADRMILTRGHMPWSVGRPEGEFLAEIAIQFGVPAEKIALTPPAENTMQEAQHVRALVSEGERIALVTSAFHMQRALHIFTLNGIDAQPFAVDFRTRADAFTPMDLLPDAGALDDTSRVVREWLGRLYYRLRY